MTAHVIISAAGMASHRPGTPNARGKRTKHGTSNNMPRNSVYTVETIAFSML